MKKNHLLYTAALLLIIASVSFQSCTHQAEPIPSGTSWIHLPEWNFYYRYKDSSFPCTMTRFGINRTIHSIKTRYCTAMFPLYYETTVVTTFLPPTPTGDTATHYMEEVDTGNWPERSSPIPAWNDWPPVSYKRQPWMGYW